MEGAPKSHHVVELEAVHQFEWVLLKFHQDLKWSELIIVVNGCEWIHVNTAEHIAFTECSSVSKIYLAADRSFLGRFFFQPALTMRWHGCMWIFVVP